MLDHSSFTLKLLAIDPKLIFKLDHRDRQLGKFYEEFVSISKELYERSATEFDQISDLIVMFEICDTIDHTIELWALNQKVAGMILDAARNQSQ
jgi:hypothetical protein